MTVTFTKRLLCGTAVLLALAEQAYAQVKSFDIPSEDAVHAIPEFARQAGIQILVPTDRLKGLQTPAIKGSMDIHTGLSKLLAGTGFSIASDDGQTIALAVPSKNVQAASVEAGNRLLDLDVERVTVTGSHIIGGGPVGDTLITISHQDLDQMGAFSVIDAINKVPQNFQGTVRMDAIAISNNASLTYDNRSNQFSGSGIDLRGLGANATLVLVNGRRLAPSGVFGSFTDVSQIPLSAVDRIEVLPDGASAVYGSDAVGGVVNIILKDHYDGAETRVQYGSYKGNGQEPWSASQSYGRDWGSGNMLLSMEYDRTPTTRGGSQTYLYTDNLAPFGGTDYRKNEPYCDPGQITAGGKTYAIPTGQNGTALRGTTLAAGSYPTCNYFGNNMPFLTEDKWSGVLRGSQRVVDWLKLTWDGLYTDDWSRHQTAQPVNLAVPTTNAFYFNPSGGTGTITVTRDLTDDIGAIVYKSHVRTYTFGLGLEAEYAGWLATLHTGPSEQYAYGVSNSYNATLMTQLLASSDPSVAFNPFSAGPSGTNAATLAQLHNSLLRINRADSKAWQDNLDISGSLFDLPAGELKLAVGGEHIGQTFASYSIQQLTGPGTSTNIPSHYRRQQWGIYGELLAPLVSPQMGIFGVERLELSLAGRYENYSDFGGSFDPKIGTNWTVIPGLTLKGSWSKSFHAPVLAQLDLGQALGVARDAPDASATNAAHTTPTLYLSGNNATLQPEKSENWTLGFVWAPEFVPGLQLSASDFGIHFTDRIGTAGVGFSSNLTLPLAQTYLTRNPTAAQIAAACALVPASFTNSSSAAGTTCLNTAVGAILDIRSQNVAAWNQNGVDLSAQYGIDTDVGHLSANANATVLFKFTTQANPTVAPVVQLNTPFQPNAFRFRGGLGWSKDAADANLWVNYQGAYHDINNTKLPITSWTTIDAAVTYTFGKGGDGLGDNIGLTVSAQNLFDATPPFVDLFPGPGFDPANSNIFGRMLTIQLRKSW